MTIYYIKQDNTIYGCGNPDCCGENFEEIDEFFHKCDCVSVDPEFETDTKTHLEGCIGGGPILKWREAKPKEVAAFASGVGKGWSEGWYEGIQYINKQVTEVFKRNEVK
jgi:hypothetical protein